MLFQIFYIHIKATALKGIIELSLGTAPAFESLSKTKVTGSQSPTGPCNGSPDLPMATSRCEVESLLHDKVLYKPYSPVSLSAGSGLELT